MLLFSVWYPHIKKQKKKKRKRKKKGDQIIVDVIMNSNTLTEKLSGIVLLEAIDFPPRAILLLRNC